MFGLFFRAIFQGYNIPTKYGQEHGTNVPPFQDPEDLPLNFGCSHWLTGASGTDWIIPPFPTQYQQVGPPKKYICNTYANELSL